MLTLIVLVIVLWFAAEFYNRYQEEQKPLQAQKRYDLERAKYKRR